MAKPRHKSRETERWLERLWIEVVIAAFGAVLIDMYSRLDALERREDISLLPFPVVSKDEGKRVEDKEEKTNAKI